MIRQASRDEGGNKLNAKPRQIPLLDTYACTVTMGGLGRKAGGGRNLRRKLPADTCNSNKNR